MISPADLLPLAESAARLGGALSRDAFGRRQVVTIKPDASEVTEVDVAVEKAIVAHIRASRPDDAFIGEEGIAVPPSVSSRSSPEIVWAIDPIDGTRNFIRGVPLFTCSVAAMLDGVPIAAAIYEPIGDLLYSAAAGAGAVRRTQSAGERMRVGPVTGNSPAPASATPAAGNSTPIVAIPSAWNPATGPFVRRICETSVVRSLGCATLHLTMIATSGVDGTFMNNCKLWDIAAGWLIAIEAGALVTSPTGSPLFPIETASYSAAEMPTLAGRPAEHARLLALRRESGA